jgi:hypothetical protein
VSNLPAKQSEGEKRNDGSLVRGILTLVLTTIATWLAGYLTNRILGPEEEEV